MSTKKIDQQPNFGWHYTLDAYGADKHALDDPALMHNIFNEMPNLLRIERTNNSRIVLTASESSTGKDPGGVSGFDFFNSSHTSGHTFSLRGFLTLDIFSMHNIGQKIPRVLDYLQETYSFNKQEARLIQRGKGDITRVPNDSRINNNTEFFGMHLLINASGIKPELLLDETRLNTFINDIPDKLKMNKISTPLIARTLEENRIMHLGGAVVIAESHIAVHHFPLKRLSVLDIYSCRPFDNQIERLKTEFAKTYPYKNVDYQIIDRGINYPIENIY